MANYEITGSQTTSGPGVYVVKTAGITLTLETWTHWADASKQIIVKDQTGSATPNITIAAPLVVGGAIDGQAATLLNNQNESLTFSPFTGGNTWLIG